MGYSCRTRPSRPTMADCDAGRAAPTRIRKSDGCAERPRVATSMRRPRRHVASSMVDERLTRSDFS